MMIWTNGVQAVTQTFICWATVALKSACLFLHLNRTQLSNAILFKFIFSVTFWREYEKTYIKS